MRRDTHKQAEPKATYRVKNWAQYNAGLIARGDVTMWIDEGMCKASAAQARKRGHPFFFLDVYKRQVLSHCSRMAADKLRSTVLC